MANLAALIGSFLLLPGVMITPTRPSMAEPPPSFGPSHASSVARELRGSETEMILCSQLNDKRYALAQAKNVKGTLDASLECSGYPQVLCGGGGGPARALNLRPVTGYPQVRQALYRRSEPVVLPAAADRNLRGGCTFDRPSRLPHWTVSGFWDGDELLLIDAAANETIRYLADGRAVGNLQDSDSRMLGLLQPSQVARTEDSFVFHLSDNRFVRLALDHRLEMQWVNLRASPTAKGRIEAIRLWALAGGDLVFCGDAVYGEDNWRLGFFRAPFAEFAGFEELASFDGPYDPARLFCRLGYPYVASLGDTAYFVKMEETPVLYAAKNGAEPRSLREAELPPRPDLPDLVTAQDFPRLFRAVERSHMPTGLFTSEGRLFVLIRQSQVAGTRWTLHELDPATGRELGRAVVPSVANHLLVVPGPKAWAFVEKGEVQEMGVQDVMGILRVPLANVKAVRSAGEGADLCGRGLRVPGVSAVQE